MTTIDQPRLASGGWQVRSALALLLLLLSYLAPPRAAAQPELDYSQVLALDRAAFRIRTFALLPVQDASRQRLVYGDRYGYIRVIEVAPDGTREVARSRTLEAPVLEVLVDDLDGDGRVEILVRLVGGRLFVFDEQVNQRWENLREDYEEISAITIANLDGDPAYEIIVLGDGRVDYIDGAQFTREFRSTQTYEATEIAVGNVDTDAPVELVLNSGTVIDTVLGEAEWNTEPFGTLIELLDIDGDGIEEVLGYTYGSPARIFEVDRRQERPLD